MRDEAAKLENAVDAMYDYINGASQLDRNHVMNHVHAINMAYGAWAWDVDKGLELEVN